MDTATAPGYTNSKRPPKLRSACNECHGAKVRCSGEKTGCQRCANLRLKCVFSISRIGKVPGKRSKANRVAAAAAAALSSAPPTSTSSSSSISTTPILSPPPLLTPSHSFESPRKIPISANFTDHASISASFTQQCYEYPTTTLPFPSETPNQPALAGIAQPNPQDNLSDLSNICWTTELDQLGGPGLLCPDWEIDADGPLPLQSHTNAPSSSTTHHDFLREETSMSNTSTNTNTYAYASPTDIYTQPSPSPSSAQCTIYLHLLHSIEYTLQLSSTHKDPYTNPDNNLTDTLGFTLPISPTTLDSILAANQRYLTTLLQITDGPSFTHTYNEQHLLFSVALEKILHLFNLAYADFRRRLEVHEALGAGLSPSDRWIRFGAFEIDFVEQTGMCRRVFVEELKRARVCLLRLTEALGGSVVASGHGHGRHEGLCQEMKSRLDRLMDELEMGVQGVNGVRMVG